MQHIILGAIISTILYVEHPSELTEVSERRFKNCNLFLDTNFVFSLLNMHAPEFSEPVNELYAIIKKNGFELKIFDFTRDEICRVIRGYIQEAYRYPRYIPVDTIYSTLKRRGWTKTDAQEFIMEIDNILIEKGIDIEGTGIDLDRYQPFDEDIRSIMNKWKPNQPLSSQNHDIAAIEKIKRMRKYPVRKIEEAKAIFLTSDSTLSKLNFLDMGHKENGTISEVILDRLLACILWLKEPQSNPPIKSIISAYSRNLFIKKAVWDKFYEVVKQLKEEGKISEDNISTLFYHNYIESVLIDLDEKEIDQINQDFILEEIEKSAKIKEEQSKTIEEKLKKKEKELSKELEDKIAKIRAEEEAKWQREIEKIKDALEKSAQKEADKKSKIYATVLSCLAILLILFLTYKSFPFFKQQKELIPLLVGGSGLIGGLTWSIKLIYKCIWQKFRFWLKRKLTKKIYYQKLKEVNLQDDSLIK